MFEVTSAFSGVCKVTHYEINFIKHIGNFVSPMFFPFFLMETVEFMAHGNIQAWHISLSRKPGEYTAFHEQKTCKVLVFPTIENSIATNGSLLRKHLLFIFPGLETVSSNS